MAVVVLFGDSLTAGYKDGEIHPTLNVELQKYLPQEKLINAGIPGNTSTDGLERLERNVLKYQPDIVVIFFGANDLAVHRMVNETQYAKNLREMITLIGKQKVILVTPPCVDQRKHYEDRPFERVLQYREIVQNLAEELEIPLVDIYQAMRKCSDLTILLQEDGLHFSDRAYGLLGGLYAQKIVEKKEALGL